MASPPLASATFDSNNTYTCLPLEYFLYNISFDSSFFEFLVSLYIISSSAILLLLSLHHVRGAISRRLWLFPSHPSKLFALNAGTLALLSIASKPTNDTSSQVDGSDYEFTKLLGSVLICTLLGVCMPSMATADLKDMWSNVAGVTLLVITAIVNIYLQLTHYIIVNLAFEHGTVVIVLGMLLLVLWIQALGLEAMVSDMKALVSDQLDALRTEVRPGYRIGVVQEKPWTWDAVEQESRIKLMMVLTSNPQNVLARSSSASVVGALVLLSLLMLWQGKVKTQHTAIFDMLQVAIIVICGFICILRWLQVACHKKRPFFPRLNLDAVPLYSHQTLSKLRHMLKAGRQTQPFVLEEGQYGLREVLRYAADFLLLLTIAPINWMLVAIMWFLHTISALLIQFLMWPIKLASSHIFCWHSNGEMTMPRDSIGVIFYAGEDASIVHAKFFKAATFVVQKQIKRASAKADITRLTAFLRASTSSNDPTFKSSNIFHALDQRGAPDVQNLHVEHGYQYGWRLTLFSLLVVLTKIEMETLERSDTLEACMDACWQAREMVEVVDEQYTPIICSKETYLAACALMWSKLPTKKKHRWLQKENHVSPYVKDPEGVLEALLWSAKSHIRQFDENKRNRNVTAFWPVQTVMHYTMHTLCQNLLNWWIDLKTCTIINAEGDGGVNAEMFVKHVRFIYGDILAGCLSNLPIAINKCTTNAVHDGRTHVVENGIFVVEQGKQLWEKLQWPPPSAPINTFGQLCQWF